MNVLGTFRIGEDIAMALDAATGNVADVSAVTAVMRASKLRTHFEPDAEASALSMTVTPRPAAGDIPAGWTVSLSDTQTSALAPGLYGIDARVVGGDGNVDITEQTAVIELTRSAM